MKTILKVSRELNIKISDIVEFLRISGYDFSDNQDQEISPEAYDTLKNNIDGFMVGKNGTLSLAKGVGNPPLHDYVPLELKIVEAASREKKLIERIIGFCEYDWKYTVARYNGECSQPIQLGLFDEVICGLLLLEEMSAEKIGELLGLDIKRDPAEKEILSNALAALQTDMMIEGDPSVYWLTEAGRAYAKDGVKFSTFSREFELYFDATGDVKTAKEIFSKLKSEKLVGVKPEIKHHLDSIKKLAEYQAPEIHFPSKNYFLQKAEFIEAHAFRAKVWVVLFENFRDTSIRAVVYDENENCIIKELSDALDQRTDVKLELIDKLVHFDESPIQITHEEKSKEQIESEKVLIVKQHNLEAALASNDIETVSKLVKEVDGIKRHFNTLEFEVELKRLFDTTSDDLWIISPWIKKAVLRRIPFFENYIRKGGKIFIGYSEPEKPSDVMVLPEAMEKLEQLEKKYANSFYIHCLPVFHWKNVWLLNEAKENVFYTGSYNILSFFVKQGSQKVRQEEMVRVEWNPDTQQKFQVVSAQFAFKYLEKAKAEFESLCNTRPVKMDRAFLQKIRTFDNLRLMPFTKLNIAEFNSAFDQLQKSKKVKLDIFRKKFFEEQIEFYRNQALSFSQRSIDVSLKRKMRSEFEKLRDEFIDFLDLQIVASSVNELIDGLREARRDNRANQNQNQKRPR